MKYNGIGIWVIAFFIVTFLAYLTFAMFYGIEILTSWIPLGAVIVSLPFAIVLTKFGDKLHGDDKKDDDENEQK